MPEEKLDEILSGIKLLNTKLYGENGFEGDIPAIKDCFKDHDKRIKRVELIMAGLVGTGVLGGGVAGIVKLLGG